MEERIFQKRVQAMSLGLLLITTIAVGRLFWLQVIKHSHYAVLANEEQLRKFEVAPERGTIYLNDRGQLSAVAMNRSLKRLYGDPRFIQDKEATAKQLAEVTGDDVGSLTEQLSADTAYVVLKKGMEPELAQQIAELELSGIGIQEEPTRVYPEASLAAQVLGFVNNEGVGQYGVEESYHNQLAGQRGLLKATTDTKGIPIATTDNFQILPRRGSDVVLTIDRNIQAKMESVLAEGMKKYNAKGASGLIMDPRSGAILAMANFPTYTPSDYTKVSDYNVFSNRTVNNAYEPGSVIKVFTMGAGLERAAVTPETTYEDQGFLTIDNYKIENARGIPTGIHTMRDVIARSINTGVVFVLNQLGGGTINTQGKEALRSFFTDKFGLGKPTGIDLPAEAEGTILPTAESDVTYANMSFGQGMTATMLQVLAGYAAIANGGTYYQPYMVDYIINPDGSVAKTEPKIKATNVLSAGTIAQLKDMMQAVVEEGGGFEAKAAGYKVGGKSGTAQIPNPAGGYFTNRDIGSFVGMAPLDNPTFVMMIRIDEPQIGTFASAAARPMWGEMMRWLLSYRGVPPQ